MPTSSFRSPDGVLIASDAGSIISTVQLVYQPVSLENAPSTAPHQELRKVFFLRTYDHRGKQVTPELLRPWVLEVPIQGLTQPKESATGLLIARYDEETGWTPLVTSYHIVRGILQVRLLEFGLFAVVAEPGVR